MIIDDDGNPEDVWCGPDTDPAELSANDTYSECEVIQ